MRIAILRGRPRKNGSSNLLADNFIRGAMEDGHEIVECLYFFGDIPFRRGLLHMVSRAGPLAAIGSIALYNCPIYRLNQIFSCIVL